MSLSRPCIPTRLLAALLPALVVGVARPGPAAGQTPGFTPGDWSRVETEHFLFLYPEPLERWALDMAQRMEAVHEAVSGLVAYAPESRVTVLVDDPGNVSNGSMSPGPLLYMWPTPPSPRSLIGENRGWGEILAVHEFAHAAHLTRPSRNPLERFLWGLLPLPITRIMLTLPRWATEGYATYIEGRLTGSGRPHGVWRPAVLRTWALEGQLPTYGQMSSSRGFYGGSMAYLAGSAYLEWLVEREQGDEEVLPAVWRRFTARQRRGFDAAFTGVFGAAPAELYGLFTVDVTERALEVRDAVEAAGGVVDGQLFQRLTWSTGDPAVSPDGEHLAVALRARDRPSRLVVIATTPDTLPTRVRERRREIFEADPEDVEPVGRRPRAQRPRATLWPVNGQAYDAPVFMPDGRGILMVRSDVAANGQLRPDLFLWDWENGGVRRITRGGAIREAAPSPDGSWAVGTRCLHAICDLVRIDLDDGAVARITSTDPLRPYYHPRVSPDGHTIVASRQVDGRWRLVAMAVDGSGERLLGPDDGAARYDAEFLPASGDLVLTSTRGGIHDLERLDPRTGAARPITRVLGAAVAPAPADDTTAFFLSLHSRGWDLRRIPVDAPLEGTAVVTGLAPAAPVDAIPVDTFPARPVGPVEPYGLGPRFRTLLPMVSASTDGIAGGAALAGSDPIGRLSWQIQGLLGSDHVGDGAALRVRWRGGGPSILAEAFLVDEPVRAATPPAEPLPGPDPVEQPAAGERYWGGIGAVELRRDGLGRSHALRAGGSGGELGDRSRVLGFADYHLRLRQSPATWRFGQALGLQAAVGRTGDLPWTRWLVSGSASVRGLERGISVAASVGGTDAPAGSVEAFAVGGSEVLLFDPAALSQRVAMPALAAGTLRGDAVRTLRIDASGFLPVDPFYWTGSVGGDDRGWRSLAGVEVEGGAGAVPYLRLPSARFRLGAAYLLDGPDEGDWRGWAMLAFRP